MASTSPHIEPPTDAIVALSTHVRPDAMTAPVLGIERRGHGVIIDEQDHILTVGYLVAEADVVWIRTRDGRCVPGYVAGYDYDTGFGLVRPAGPLDLPAARLGDSSALVAGDRVLVAGSEDSGRVNARVIARREFAGHWEYVISNALYTSPAHNHWAGAGLFDAGGSLCGIGSLLVQRMDGEGEAGQANLHVPVELLLPVLDELREYGARLSPPRPWLGLFVQDDDQGFTISGLYENGPAAEAGLRSGDTIHAVAGTRPASLAELFRSIWQIGPAGAPVPLTIERNREQLDVAVPSADRQVLMRGGSLH